MVNDTARADISLCVGNTWRGGSEAWLRVQIKTTQRPDGNNTLQFRNVRNYSGLLVITCDMSALSSGGLAFLVFSGSDLHNRVNTRGGNHLQTLAFTNTGNGRAERDLNLAEGRLSLEGLVRWIEETFVTAAEAGRRPLRSPAGRAVGPKDKLHPHQPTTRIWGDDMGVREDIRSPAHRTEYKTLHAVIAHLIATGKFGLDSVLSFPFGELEQCDFILDGKHFQVKTLIANPRHGAGLWCSLFTTDHTEGQIPYHSFVDEDEHSFDYLIAAYWKDSTAYVWGPIPMAVLREEGLVKTGTQDGKIAFYVHSDRIQRVCKPLSSGVLGGRPAAYGWTKNYFAGSVYCLNNK